MLKAFIIIASLIGYFSGILTMINHFSNKDKIKKEKSDKEK